MNDSKTGAGALQCVVVTPETTVLDTPADFVAMPLYDGQCGIGANHSPLIGRLGYGELRILVRVLFPNRCECGWKCLNEKALAIHRWVDHIDEEQTEATFAHWRRMNLEVR